MSRDGRSDAFACPSCGAGVGEDDRFCPACGRNLGDGSDADDGTTDRTATDGAATDGPAADRARTDDPDGGDSGSVDRRTATEGLETEPTTKAEHEDADDDLESWQKRCTECRAVLVTQAVRCTNCGADQSNGTREDGRRPPDRDDRPRTAGSRRTADGRGRDGGSHDRNRRTERPEATRPPEDSRDGRGQQSRRTTDAGHGEVQYERERRRQHGHDDRQLNGRRHDERPPDQSQSDSRRPVDTGYRDGSRGNARRSHSTQSARDEEPSLRERERSRRGQASRSEPFHPPVPSDRWWVGVLVPALLFLVGAFVGASVDLTAVASGTIPWVGDAYGLLELAIVLTPTLAPFALYFDRRYVSHETGDRPSAAYFLVAVPYLNVLVTGLYLWSRWQRIDRA